MNKHFIYDSQNVSNEILLHFLTGFGDRKPDDYGCGDSFLVLCPSKESAKYLMDCVGQLLPEIGKHAKRTKCHFELGNHRIRFAHGSSDDSIMMYAGLTCNRILIVDAGIYSRKNIDVLRTRLSDRDVDGNAIMFFILDVWNDMNYNIAVSFDLQLEYPDRLEVHLK